MHTTQLPGCPLLDHIGGFCSGRIPQIWKGIVEESARCGRELQFLYIHIHIYLCIYMCAYIHLCMIYTHLRVYPDKRRFPTQCHQWQCHSSLMHLLLLQTQSETARRNTLSCLFTVSDVPMWLNTNNSRRSYIREYIVRFSAVSNACLLILPHVFPSLAWCWLSHWNSTVALSQVMLLFATQLPGQCVHTVIFKVKFELSHAWAIHVVVKLQTLRPPGAPQCARQ